MTSAIVALAVTFAQSQAAVPQPPPDSPVRLTLRLADGRRQFRPGEVIPLELEFNSAVTRRFRVDGATYDRSGRLTIDEFRIDRMDDVWDPMLDYFGSVGGLIGGGIRSIGMLGEEPFTVKLELNDWFRFDTPGTYRLAVKSRRVTDEAGTPHGVVPIESNTITFEIVPRDLAWEASTLEVAIRMIDAKPSPHDARAGCRMLRFLGTDAAAMEMVRRFSADRAPECTFDYIAGLFGARNRSAVVRAMEAGLRDTDQPVTGNYLRTLAALSAYLQHPELRPEQTPATKGRLSTFGELSRRPDLVDAAMSIYGDILCAALPDKTERARAITLAEALSLPQCVRSAGSATLRAQLAAAFLDLPVERQTVLLEHQWPALAGPAMLPALRRLITAPPAGAPSAADLSLRRLAQLAPEEARPLLLREIQAPRPGATLKTLGVLPDAELPALDDALARNFEASNTEIHAALVHRYATRKIAPRILARVADTIGAMACNQQASILAYFLRVDEVTGATLLDRAMTSRITGCWRSLNQIAALRMTPVVERRAIADLDSPDADVVVGAIRTLGEHGSSAALGPLQLAFERWHGTWASRAAELVDNRAAEHPNAREAMMVEDALRQAIGAGRGWLLRAGALRELQALCVTENCRTQVGHMIHDDDTTIILSRISEPDESQIELAQYGFTSISGLEDKLSQYPRGTAFVLLRRGDEMEDVGAAIARLTAFASSRGMSIRTVGR